MIRSRTITGQHEVNSDVFPEAAECHKPIEGTSTTTYCDNPLLHVQLTEQRIGRFMLINQQGAAFDDCLYEICRTGIPVLMLTLAKESDMIRSRHDERHWKTGDVCLALTPQEDVVVNRCPKGHRLNLWNLVVPEPVLRQMAEQHPEAMGRFCHDLEKEATVEYNTPHTQAGQRLLRSVKAIECCTDMGKYAEKYVESKMLDCLSEFFNQTDPNGGIAYNFTLRMKMWDARHIMEQHYDNPPSLHELALMVGTNECTLKKAYRQMFGTTVFQHLFDFRMGRAMQMLRDTELPISDISLNVGFEHQSHFCTAFRRCYGITPSSIRLHPKKLLPLSIQ